MFEKKLLTIFICNIFLYKLLQRAFEEGLKRAKIQKAITRSMYIIKNRLYFIKKK